MDIKWPKVIPRASTLLLSQTLKIPHADVSSMKLQTPSNNQLCPGSHFTNFNSLPF